MGFAEDIQRNIDKALINMSDNLNEITGKLFYGIRQDTPILTGVLTNSWYTAVGSHDTTIGSAPDTNGSASTSRIASTLASNPFLGKDNTVTMTNSVDYAYRAEYIGWRKNDPTNTTKWNWTGNVTNYAMVWNNLTKAKV